MLSLMLQVLRLFIAIIDSNNNQFYYCITVRVLNENDGASNTIQHCLTCATLIFFEKKHKRKFIYSF